MADKYLVREWIKQEIGNEYLIPLLGVWDSFDEIDFEDLPKSFVLKCNHGAKMNIIVRDKEKLDKEKIRKLINGWLEQDFGLCEGTFQLQYSLIPRKIIAEKYMEETGFTDLRDYKFFCFNGQPMYCQVISDRSENETVDFFDMKWNHLDFTGLACFRNSSEEISAPKSLEKMVSLSQTLSKNFSFVRVDFYEIDGKPYFGEMTFTPASGLGHFEPDEMNKVLGDLIQLPEKKPIPKVKK